MKKGKKFEYEPDSDGIQIDDSLVEDEIKRAQRARDEAAEESKNFDYKDWIHAEYRGFHIYGLTFGGRNTSIGVYVLLSRNRGNVMATISLTGGEGGTIRSFDSRKWVDSILEAVKIYRDFDINGKESFTIHKGDGETFPLISESEIRILYGDIKILDGLDERV